MTIEDNLTHIEQVIKSNLPEGIQLYDLVYRPFNMSPFGGKGYSIYFASIPVTSRAGIRFDNMPSDTKIIERMHLCAEDIRKRQEEEPKHH